MTEESKTGANSTVLIVDDNRELVLLFEAWLKDDYEIRKATSGFEGLEEVDEDVDMVLLDREMPELSGAEVLEKIREQGFDCQVTMVTGLEPELDIIDMEFDEYLVKPVSDDELKDTLQQLELRSLYEEKLQEEYRLASRLAILREYIPESELEKDDGYAELVSRLDHIQAEVREVTAEFTDRDYRAQFGRLTSASD